MDTETTTPEHTPTPWRIGKFVHDHKEDDYVTIEHGENPTHAICRMTTWGSFSNGEGEANAQLIVTAVNSHDSNVKRIAELTALLKNCEEWIGGLTGHGYTNKFSYEQGAEIHFAISEALKRTK